MKISGIYRTSLILILHLVGIFVHSLFIASGETRDACLLGAPLYDVVHSFAAKGVWPFSHFQYIKHELIILILILLFILLIIRHSQKQLLLRRFLVFHFVMSAIRGFFIWITTLPSAGPTCFDRGFESIDVFTRSITLTLSAIGIPYDWYALGTPGRTCCDNIISGHTSMLLVLTLLLTSSIKNKSVKIGLWILSSFTMLGLIGVRWHYTVDILVTLVIGIALYNWYILKVKYSPNVFTNFIEEPEMYPTQKGLTNMSLNELFSFRNK